VAQWANWRHGGLPLRLRVEALRDAMLRMDYPARAAIWHEWFTSHPYGILLQAPQEAANAGARMTDFQAACPPALQTQHARRRKWERGHLQTWFTKRLQHHLSGPGLPYTRRRLQRFTMHQCTLRMTQHCAHYLT
jgi:hypothetical protein